MSFLGAWLVKIQGVGVLRRISRDLSDRRVPAAGIVDGGLLLIAGTLLLIPGFLTDLVGLVLLVPVARAGVRNGLIGRWTRKYTDDDRMRPAPPRPPTNPGSQGPNPRRLGPGRRRPGPVRHSLEAEQLGRDGAVDPGREPVRGIEAARTGDLGGVGLRGDRLAGVLVDVLLRRTVEQPVGQQAVDRHDEPELGVAGAPRAGR